MHRSKFLATSYLAYWPFAEGPLVEWFAEFGNDICKAWLTAAFQFLDGKTAQKQLHAHDDCSGDTGDSDTAIPSTSALMVRESLPAYGTRRIRSKAA
jgi:hypothetical protein